MKNLLLIILLLFIISCEDTIEKNAELITRQDLENKAGLEFFKPKYDEYSPDNSSIAAISQNFITNQDKVVLFIKPSCLCRGTQELFPQLIKSLESAGIDDTNYEIYAVGDEEYSHPYQNIFTLDTVPKAVLLRNNTLKYSIYDSLNKNILNSNFVEFYLANAVN